MHETGRFLDGNGAQLLASKTTHDLDCSTSRHAARVRRKQGVSNHMPQPSSAVSNRRAASPRGVSVSRSVHIVYERGAWCVRSEDGEVGGIFVSHDAARRFAEREFRLGQGRPVLDDTGLTMPR